MANLPVLRKSPGMSRRTVLSLGGAALLAGCGGGRDGERRRWFGLGGRRDDPTTLEPEEGYGSTQDPRPLAPRVDSMVIEQVTGGVIVRASAVMPTQKFWDADLVAARGDNPRDGVYRFDFRAWPPVEPTQANVGPPRSRELHVAAYISNGDLEGVRSVAVVSQAGGISRSL